MKKTIVISAVNLNIGGTLTILNDCLRYLSEYNKDKKHRVVAIVYDKKLCLYPHIEYIETQWPKKRWVNRLWYEYVSMKKISKGFETIDLWFSLHDTTPNVVAKSQAVYCHNPFPFYKWKFKELFFAPKIVLFSLFSKFIYKKGIHRNRYVVVQQQWIKKEFQRLFSLKEKKIIVALPDRPSNPDSVAKKMTGSNGTETIFVFASSANSHKNFECLLEAAKVLTKKNCDKFKIYITLSGMENAYARWLKKKWGNLPMVEWLGFQSKEDLFALYEKSHVLVFPSKIETWGLPITEYMSFEKPMLLADLPYAKETSGGAQEVSFFDPDEAEDLAGQMGRLIEGDKSFLRPQEQVRLAPPVVYNWSELFTLLLA